MGANGRLETCNYLRVVGADVIFMVTLVAGAIVWQFIELRLAVHVCLVMSDRFGIGSD
jgi:hypothetical protein